MTIFKKILTLIKVHYFSQGLPNRFNFAIYQYEKSNLFLTKY